MLQFLIPAAGIAAGSYAVYKGLEWVYDQTKSPARAHPGVDEEQQPGEDPLAGCMCVEYDSEAHLDAFRKLIRPEEVRHLVGFRVVTRAEDVAGLVRARFVSGRWVYEEDPKDCDRFCPPLTTLHRGVGDCDDWSIVVASLMRAVGLDADIVVGVAGSSSLFGLPNHAWVEGYDGAGFFLLEATSGVLWRYRPAHYTRLYST